MGGRGRAEGRNAGGGIVGRRKGQRRKCWRGRVREEVWGRGSAEGGSAGDEEERPK